MRFNIKKYLDNLDIEYIEDGNNVPVDSIAIHCIFCGDRDPSEHLAINYKKGFYFCWICERTGDLINLVKHLEGISWSEAKIRVTEPRLYTRDAVEAVKNALKSRKNKSSILELNSAKLPDEAKKVSSESKYYMLRQFLVRRGVSMETAVKYNFYYCKVGKYAHRLIIPVYDEEGLIVGFGARAMNDKKPPYLYPSGWSTGMELYGANHIGQSDVLVLVEGIFDAIRLGNIAVASFTHRVSDIQALMLVKWYREGKFSTLAVAYDGDSYDLGCAVAERLGVMMPTCCLRLPFDKDPDDLGREKIVEMINSQVGGNLNCWA